jgi:glutamate dehydrogenase
MPRKNSPSASSPYESFAQLFLESFTPEDKVRISMPILQKITNRQFEKAQQRKSELYLFAGLATQKSHGFERPSTIIEIICDDMAFIVDSVTAYVVARGLHIDTIIHPLLYIKKAQSKITAVSKINNDTAIPTAFVYIELSRRLTTQQCAEVTKDIQQIIEDVHLATSDWPRMKASVKDLLPRLSHAPSLKGEEKDELLAFIDYIHDDNFTLLGVCRYDSAGKGLKRAPKTGLGLLSAERSAFFLNGEEKALLQHADESNIKNPVIVTKLALMSPVHRRVPVDVLVVKSFDKNGVMSGITLVLGLFTSVTYSRSLRGIPWLRFKAAKILERANFDTKNHEGRALRHIIEKFPRDEFLQMDVSKLYTTCLQILHLQQKPRIASFLREDPFGRTITALVYVPRDRFDTRLRQKFQTVLEQHLHARCTNFYSTVDDSHLVRIIFVLEWPHGVQQKYNAASIEMELRNVGRSWAERLAEALNDRYQDGERTAQIVERYGVAFPLAYQENYSARQATHDIVRIDRVLHTHEMGVDLFRSNQVQPHQLCLKIFTQKHPVPLSEILPILENMGLKVIAEYPYPVMPHGETDTVWIQDVLLEQPSSIPVIDVASIKDAFEKIFLSVTNGSFENDSLNKLVVKASLQPREIVILRSFVRYIRQTGLNYSLSYLEQALTDHATICRILCAYFAAKFAPNADKDREKNIARITKEFLSAMDQVTSLDQDRILRSVFGAMESTLRTNAYQTDTHGQEKDYISLKFNSQDVPHLPEPRPYREIFVYAPRVEGIHLRGDRIARGGLRWSDRHEDFRTEILGLMKAQMVKNAVIVPMGAKGGFIVKKPPATGGREAYLQEGITCYRTFIRGLLDITDNQVSGKIIPPKNVVRHDENDPYLVVAADKGTATFSDIANALSLEYGFWLGDAFASGGSAGYDHKKMAITARGAWESVKRHFREMNHDTQTQPFTVIGVGDMGGDVFGNGMLQSNQIKLLAAFNHLHIFCDPTPDPKKSFAERQRLFNAAKGWDAYDTKILSKGGRIFSRADKTLKLTPEIQFCFGIKQSEISPPDFIRILLKHEADLLFFGGIGTFVKSSSETDMDAADRANDSLRINAEDLRAKVIGEGANMGMTQRARIAYALRGGRLNTDFIDNSAGVDTSDHEVNIKILLAQVAQDKKQKLDTKKRNALLVKMTDEVAQLVLRDNYQQTQALSLMELQATSTLDQHAQFITALERDGKLNRALEFLPSDEDIAQRRQTGKGLTRPEMSLLLSYSKIVLAGDLLATTLPDDDDMVEWAVTYFPKALQNTYTKFILNHQLKREIIATSIANSLINRMGPTYLQLAMEKTGSSAADIVKAFLTVREVFALRPLWDQIESLDNKVPAKIQLEALRKISRLAERETTWFATKLRKDKAGLDKALFQKNIARIKNDMAKILPPAMLKMLKDHQAQWVRDGMPAEAAWQIALFKVIGSGPDIVTIAHQAKADVIDTAKIYFTLGERFQCDWLRTQAKSLHSHDQWVQTANAQILDQLYAVQAEVTMSLLTAKNATVWEQKHKDKIAHAQRIVSDMQSSGSADLAMLTVAVQTIRDVIA